MSLYELAKDAVTLARQADNIELTQKILDLQSHALEMQEENRRLRERVGELEAAARTDQGLESRDNAYWRGEKGPFCTACWDTRSQLVRLHESGSGRLACPSCKAVARGGNVSFRISRG